MRSVTEHYYSTAINDRITAYEFDNFDRLQKQVDSFGQPTKFGYDLNGVRTSLTDADNKTTQYIPDELNRIAQVINAQGTTQYDYFRDSRLKTVTYPNNIRSRYTYDTAGWVKHTAPQRYG